LINAKSRGKLDIPLTSSTSMPQKLIDIVIKAIKTNRKYRYRDTREMEIDLEKFVRNQTDQPGYTYLQELVNKFWS